MRAFRQNKDIQVLRALAIIFTVLCHQVELVRWKGAWTSLYPKVDFWGGVDLFFCISGFVIAGSLLRQKRLGSFREFAVPFYIRRIFRIWPAALLWLFIPIFAAWFLGASAFGKYESVLADGVAAAFQVANFYFMLCTGACGKEAIYWSLSLEEQFYLIFPFLLFFMPRRYLRYLLMFLIVLQFPFHRPVESALWYLRTDAICYGILIAMAHPEGLIKRHVFGAIRDRRFATALGCMLILAVAVISITPALWINAGLLAAASACLVWLASYDADLILPWRSVRPFLLWVGSRSYAIYLVHEPCFWAVRELCHRSRFYPGAHPSEGFVLVFTAAALVLVAVASELTFRLVETPLRLLGSHLASQFRGRISARSSLA
jgi:peptidoglycan/LPS O-acetylase OafA/YrhL